MDAQKMFLEMSFSNRESRLISCKVIEAFCIKQTQAGSLSFLSFSKSFWLLLFLALEQSRGDAWIIVDRLKRQGFRQCSCSGNRRCISLMEGVSACMVCTCVHAHISFVCC